MKKLLFSFFIYFIINNCYGDNKILYLDVAFLINQSDSGKYINSELKKINDKNIEEFIKQEKSIKLEEENILKQKNILKEDEFNNKVLELKNKYKSYKEYKEKKNKELKTLRNNAGNKLLEIINEILAEYSVKNQINIIVDKKNIIIGKTELDVTNDIMKLLNNKIKKVELKK
jgi:outer membrane protein